VRLAKHADKEKGAGSRVGELDPARLGSVLVLGLGLGLRFGFGSGNSILPSSFSKASPPWCVWPEKTTRKGRN
jgi:hypothetical protein